MALLVSTILTNRVRILLRDIDTGGIQWKDSELIEWMNEGCGEIARVRPEASSLTTELLGDATPVAGQHLVPGALQRIPDGGDRLLEVVSNSLAGVMGRTVRRVDRSTLDNEDPDWPLTAPTNQVYRYVASLTDPRSFYTYPPSLGDATSGLLIVYSAPPVTVTLLGDSFPLPDMYASVAANYILYRAFSKLTESADAQNKAIGFLNIFNAQIGDTVSSMEGDNATTRDPIISEHHN